MLRILPLLLVAAACSSAPPASAASVPALSLLGQWRITALDSHAPVEGRDGRPAVLTFDEHGYGGYAGCNAFGGQGLAHEDRFYGGLALSTAMACGPPFDVQETSVHRLLGSAPRIEWLGPDRVALTAPNQRLELVRTGGLPPDRLIVAAIPMIGTSWRFGALDGRAIEMPGARFAPTLTVEGARFTLDTPCLTTAGVWNQPGPSSVTLTPDHRTARACDPASRQQSEAWAEAMQGTLRYGNGPNGEILLAGGGHWMTGDLVRRGSSEAGALAGSYEIDGGPSAAQRNGALPPKLVLTRRAFYLWDGCNHSEGLAIMFERQLSVHGSGLTTLATCPPDRGGDRLKSIVLDAPRIGRIPGGLLISSSAGTIRLRRTGDAPPGTGGVTTSLLPGMRFNLLSGSGGTLAILPGGRFQLTQPCGVTKGRWRRAPGELDGGIRFGPEQSAEDCQRDPTARNLLNIFLGNADVAIGPNRDIALIVGRLGAVRARLER